MKEILLPIDEMFPTYRKIKVKEQYSPLLYNGNPFYRNQAERIENLQDGEQIRVYDHMQRFIGLYRYETEKRQFKIIKMFFDK